MSQLLARHFVPRSLAAFCQTASRSAFGRLANQGQKRILPRNAPALWTPAMSMSNKYDMINEAEDILPPKLQKSLNKIIREEKFTNFSVETQLIPHDGGSFMAVRREITIKGQTDKGEKEINLYVKTMIPGAELDIYSVPEVYERETKMYLEIFKVFNELQDEANVPYEERYYTTNAYEGVDNETIIMENLAKQGYKMCDRMEVMPLKFVELSIQQMARFHGMTFAIEARRPEFFEAKVKTLKQPFRYNTPAWDNFVGNVSRRALQVLDPEARRKAEAYLPTIYDKYSKYADDPDTVRTLVHHDFRANNVMVKMNDDEITEVVLIDFQQTFYGCPIIDFVYFIFSGTDQDFRSQHLESLKNLYYDTMSRYLKYFNLDIDSYYSREEFERLYKERLDYGLMVSLWLVPIILADKGAVPDVTKVELSEANFKINDTVRNRVRGAVDEFIKWGYL